MSPAQITAFDLCFGMPFPPYILSHVSTSSGSATYTVNKVSLHLLRYSSCHGNFFTRVWVETYTFSKEV